jgi:hypothetical protein
MPRLEVEEATGKVVAILCDHDGCSNGDLTIFPGGFVLCEQHKDDSKRKVIKR